MVFAMRVTPDGWMVIGPSVGIEDPIKDWWKFISGLGVMAHSYGKYCCSSCRDLNQIDDLMLVIRHLG